MVGTPDRGDTNLEMIILVLIKNDLDRIATDDSIGDYCRCCE